MKRIIDLDYDEQLEMFTMDAKRDLLIECRWSTIKWMRFRWFLYGFFALPVCAFFYGAIQGFFK